MFRENDWRPKPELLTVTVEPQPGFGTGGAAQLHFQNPNRHELANRGMEPLIDDGRTEGLSRTCSRDY
jgi:hypothetical protein